jgi:hypothetical protein
LGDGMDFDNSTAICIGAIIGCNICSWIGGISFSLIWAVASSISFDFAFSTKSFIFGNSGNGNLIDGLNWEPIDGFFFLISLYFSTISLANIIAGWFLISSAICSFFKSLITVSYTFISIPSIWIVCFFTSV